VVFPRKQLATTTADWRVNRGSDEFASPVRSMIDDIRLQATRKQLVNVEGLEAAEADDVGMKSESEISNEFIVEAHSAKNRVVYYKVSTFKLAKKFLKRSQKA
jgi:hypothetical protein